MTTEWDAEAEARFAEDFGEPHRTTAVVVCADMARAAFKAGEAKGAAAERGRGIAKGVSEARRAYAQAWADATGDSIEDVAFTTGFLRAEVSDMREALRIHSGTAEALRTYTAPDDREAMSQEQAAEVLTEYPDADLSAFDVAGGERAAVDETTVRLEAIRARLDTPDDKGEA